MLSGAFLIMMYDIGAMGSDYVYTRQLVPTQTDTMATGKPLATHSFSEFILCILPQKASFLHLWMHFTTYSFSEFI
jgi:hypothetical protein